MKLIIEKNIKSFSIILTLILSFLLGFISIGYFGDYGWTVFILIPLLIGFIPPFLIGKVKEISRNKSFSVSFLTFGIASFCLLAFALEGMICIAMSLPLMIPIVWIGSYIGYKINNKRKLNTSSALLVIVFSSVAFMGFDTVSTHNNLIAVKTKIIVNAPIETVWNNVVTFNKIEEPTDWIFKTGISYPTDATIEGEGVNAIRYCNFTTGSFVEPITAWDEPTLLQFDVVEQPIPMNEFNPFWDIHPPHLDGYFLSQKGQFKLTKISDGITELEGTTWYKVDIQPEIYWKTWSDFIIHRIHKRVLNHIKEESE